MLTVTMGHYGSGGASMEIEIEQITDASELPTVVGNGVIYVVTSTTINYTTIDTVKPDTANTGDIYIEISDDTSVPAIDLGNDTNAVNIRARRTYQWINSRWKQIEAFVGMAGAWNTISRNAYIYGVHRNTGDSNPNTTLTYTDDATDFSAAHMVDGNAFNDNGWLGRFPFIECYPCMVKDGAEYCKLNKDNLAQKTDGTTTDIISGAGGDAMRFTPEMWIDFENQNTRISNIYQAGWYHVPAHYWPLFGGYVLSDKLRSLASKTMTTSKTRAQFRTYAVANGTGYQQLEWRYLMAEMAMFQIMFKSLDGQGSLGRGYNTESLARTTGTHLTKGSCWGSQTINSGVVFLWSEVTWEFVWIFVDGFWTNASNVMHIKNSGAYADSTADMINTGKVWPASSIASQFGGDNSFGIWPTVGGGSTSTHYCDNFLTGTGNNILLACGSNIEGLGSGPFALRADGGISAAASHWGAALSFTPPAV